MATMLLYQLFHHWSSSTKKKQMMKKIKRDSWLAKGATAGEVHSRWAERSKRAGSMHVQYWSRRFASAYRAISVVWDLLQGNRPSSGSHQSPFWTLSSLLAIVIVSTNIIDGLVHRRFSSITLESVQRPPQCILLRLEWLFPHVCTSNCHVMSLFGQ